MIASANDSLFQVRSQLCRDLIDWYSAVVKSSNKIEWQRGNLGPATLKSLLVNVTVLKERWQRREESEQTSDHKCELPGRFREFGQEGVDLEPDLTDIEPSIARTTERLSRRTRPVRVPWKEQLPLREHTVILGGPGEGKSILAASTALQTAEEELARLSGRETDADDLILPIFLDLQYFPKASGDSSLDEIVVSMLRRFSPITPRLEMWIKAKLFTGQCLWILDGLDQIGGREAVRVDRWLEDIGRSMSKAVVTCRTQNFVSGRAPGNRFTKYELASFTFSEACSFIEKWFGSGSSQGERLLTLIKDHPWLEDACRSPLIATFVCIVCDAITADTRRTDLYQMVIERLQSKDGKSGLTDGELGADFLEMQRLAWGLFSERPESNHFTREQFFSAVGGKSTNATGMFLDRLIDCRVLFKSESGEPQHYSFIHRTILEFLAAKYMAGLVKGKGWSRARIYMPATYTRVPLRAVLEANSWMPAWSSAIAFLGGCLAGQIEALVDLLWQEPVDLCWFRRILALECLASAREEHRHPEQVDRISEEAFTFLWSATQRTTQTLVSGYDSGCKALAELNGRAGEEGVHVMDTLFLRAFEGSETALNMLESIGSTAAVHRRAITVLLSTLATETGEKEVFEERTEVWGDEQRRAANALWCARKAVERQGSQAVQFLLGLFKHDAYIMRMCAVHRLWAQVAHVAAQTPGVISQVLESLNDDGPEEWEGGWNFHSWDFEQAWAAVVLGYMGDLAGNDERVIPALMKRFRHAHPEVMRQALDALSRMPVAAGRHDEVVPALFNWFLNGDDHLFHTDSPTALKRITPFAERHFSMLVPLLIEIAVEGKAESPGVSDTLLRAQAVYMLGVIQGSALEKMGGAGIAKYGDAVGAVGRALNDQEEWVRSAAIDALKDIGTVTGRSEFVPDLARLLKEDPEPSVRIKAATALGQISRLALRDCSSDLLHSLFADPAPEVQRAAAEALGKCVGLQSTLNSFQDCCRCLVAAPPKTTDRL